MKRNLLSLAAIFTIALFSNNATAQTNSDSATSDAFATIVAPIEIVNNTPLQFGTIISGVGTVTVSTADVRSFSVAAMNPNNQGVTPTSAVFTVTGEPGYTYSLAFTNATETLTEPGSSDTMSAGTFVASTGGGIGLTGTLNAGTDTLKVGATLSVTSGLSAGVYAGTFEVTVAYN